MAVADFGIKSFAFVNVRDIQDYSKPMIEIKVDDLAYQHINIDVPGTGRSINSTVNHPELTMKFIRKENAPNIDIDIDANQANQKVKANFKVKVQGKEGITGIIKNTKDELKHTLNTKIPLLEFVGDMTIDGKSILECSKPKPCLGLHDNSRGFASYVGKWIWGTTIFKDSKGKDVAVNLGWTHDDTNCAYDAVFIDGKIYKLDPLVMTQVADGHWKWVKYPKLNNHPKNSLEIEFKRDSQHGLTDNLLFISVDLISNYGKFSGRIKTEDGHDIEFKDKFGFFEDMHSKW